MIIWKSVRKSWQAAALRDEGKLKIGPLYILQDDYRFQQANVRNTLTGQQGAEKWGQVHSRLVISQILLEAMETGTSNFTAVAFM